MKIRTDLRVIVSSATIDAEDMKRFFNTNFSGDPSKDNVFIVSIPGRTYPVDVHYLKEPTSDYLMATVETILEIHKSEPLGDILAFLTGQEEIEKCVDMINERIR